MSKTISMEAPGSAMLLLGLEILLKEGFCFLAVPQKGEANVMTEKFKIIRNNQCEKGERINTSFNVCF